MRCTITRLANQENVHYLERDLEVSILEFLIHNLLNDMLNNG